MRPWRRGQQLGHAPLLRGQDQFYRIPSVRTGPSMRRAPSEGISSAGLCPAAYCSARD